jgi:predicted Co/Zn/Cd cation transporter (cation efflux family)
MPPSDFSLSRLLTPSSIAGAVLLAVVVFCVCLVLATIVRRAARRVEKNLTDVTALRFLAALTQVLIYVVGFIPNSVMANTVVVRLDRKSAGT